MNHRRSFSLRLRSLTATIAVAAAYPRDRWADRGFPRPAAIRRSTRVILRHELASNLCQQVVAKRPGARRINRIRGARARDTRGLHPGVYLTLVATNPSLYEQLPTTLSAIPAVLRI